MENISLKDFGARLSEAIGDESVNSFAKRCGISEAAVRNYLKDRMPSVDVALRMAEVADVSLEWLITGKGSRAVQMHYPSNIIATQQLPGFTMVPRLDIHASAGTGAVALSEDPVDFLAFPEDWLRARNINPSFARILSAKGDSMEPTIRDGDILLVDTSIDRVRDNSIYILVYNGLLLVKRMHGKFDGAMTLISDNTLYPPETISAADVPNLRVAGRVMWFGRSI